MMSKSLICNVNRNMSAGEIALVIPYSRSGILRVLKQKGIERRNSSFQSSLDLDARKKNKIEYFSENCIICGLFYTATKWDQNTCEKAKCKSGFKSLNSTKEYIRERKQFSSQFKKLDILKMRNEGKSYRQIKHETRLTFDELKRLLNSE